MEFASHEDGLRLLGAEFDQPPPASQGRLFLICSLQRTGSWALCRMLVRLGLGLPSEYFHKEHGRTMAARLGAPAVDGQPAWKYLAALSRVRTTVSGHVGIKVQYRQLRSFFPGAAGARLLQGARVIYLYRQDLLAQAVSLNFLRLTGISQHVPNAPVRPVPDAALGDFSAIDRMIDVLSSDEALWRRTFAKGGVKPLFVSHEQIVAKPKATLARVARFISAAPELLSPERISAAIETGRVPDRPVESGPSKSEVLAAYVAARRRPAPGGRG